MKRNKIVRNLIFFGIFLSAAIGSMIACKVCIRDGLLDTPISNFDIILMEIIVGIIVVAISILIYACGCLIKKMLKK